MKLDLHFDEEIPRNSPLDNLCEVITTKRKKIYTVTVDFCVCFKHKEMTCHYSILVIVETDVDVPVRVETVFDATLLSIDLLALVSEA